MQDQRYEVRTIRISHMLSMIEQGRIAIPEIQRPFVWKVTQVRDLIDSLYKKYPIGYIIVWENPSVRCKDGSHAYGKYVMIDGQQRITALTSALLAKEILNEYYKPVRITIAFNPIEERFETLNTAIAKDSLWIHNISELFLKRTTTLEMFRTYIERNQGNNVNEDHVFRNINKLDDIMNNDIGLISLGADLDIEVVTEIFTRINSKGTRLEEYDFVMSKIASKEEYNGVNIRKAIDYFCHLIQRPESFSSIRDNDTEFHTSPLFNVIAWVHKEKIDVYRPSYKDIIRVAYTYKFIRGKLNDFVALLAGRNFEKRSYDDEIARTSFNVFQEGITQVCNESYFQRFVMIIKSIGFIHSKFITSSMSINFAYALYLYLKTEVKIEDVMIERYVQKWYVLSLLVRRHSESPESVLDEDIRKIHSQGIEQVLYELEQSYLSNAFWEFTIPSELNTTSTRSIYFILYLVALCKEKTKGFLSKNITVADMIIHKGDMHHIYPKRYLEKHGYKRDMYNQVANYVYCESPINIKIGDSSPQEYYTAVQTQLGSPDAKLSALNSMEALQNNLIANDIPELMKEGTIDTYEEFLRQRRMLMAKRIKQYWESL